MTNGPAITPCALLIEHDAAARLRLRGALEASGWTVVETADENSAGSLAARHQPAAILLDANLPSGGTERVAHRLKTDPVTCNIPIIVLSLVNRPAGQLEPRAADALGLAPHLPILLAKLQHVLARRATGKPLVLVVDDEPDLVEILTAFLQQRGFAASGVCSGADALEVLRPVQPDAVLLDLDMPQIDGWEVLQRIRADAKLQGARVVILTGRDQTPSDRRNGLSRGASEYLTKPCAPDTIVRALDAALKQPPPAP